MALDEQRSQGERPVDPSRFRPPQRPDAAWIVTLALAVAVGLAPLFALYPLVFSWLGPWDLSWRTALMGAGVAVAVRILMDVVVLWEDWLRQVSPDQGTVRATVQLLVADLVGALLAGVVMRPELSVVLTSLLVGGAWMVLVTLAWDRPWESTSAEDMDATERLGESFSELVDELEQDRADIARRQAARLESRAEERRRAARARGEGLGGPGTPGFPTPDARDGVDLDPVRRPPGDG